MPVSVESFVDRLIDEDQVPDPDRVRISVDSEMERSEPTYYVSYEALRNGNVVLKAEEKFSCLECKNAHLTAEGQIPSEAEEMVRKRAHRKVKDVKEVLMDSGINVTVHYSSNQ